MSSKKPYISCIKINGVPILPPLITSKVRTEIRYYKELSKELEKKLQGRKKLKEYIKEIDKLKELTKSSELSSESPEPFSSLSTVANSPIKTLENKLTFSEETNEVPKNPSNNKVNLTLETIDVSEYTDDGIKLISESDCVTANSELDKSVSVNYSNNSTESEVITGPRLSRSNSYTLEAPSPVLLAHLQREKQKNEQRRMTLDNSKIPTLKRPATAELNSNYQVFETDINVQQIIVRTPLDDDNNRINEIEPNLLNILKQLPLDCREKVIEVLENQTQNKRNNNIQQAVKSVSKQNCIDFQPKVNGKISTPIINQNSFNQSLYYTVMETPNDDDDGSRMQKDADQQQLLKKRSPLSPRNLFANKSQHLQVAKKDQAASIIGAAVRGYLTRRLLKTERVQNLKQTIKDVVVTALELSTSENLSENDVEFHRRLIQQLDATLYAFHDVFFTLSKREQMSIIALDRQRKLFKAQRRHSSSRVSSARSDLSSTKSRPRANSTNSIKSNRI